MPRLLYNLLFPRPIPFLSCLVSLASLHFGSELIRYKVVTQIMCFIFLLAVAINNDDDKVVHKMSKGKNIRAAHEKNTVPLYTNLLPTTCYTHSQQNRRMWHA